MQVVMPRMAGIGASRAPRLSRHRIVVTVVGVEIAFADVGGWDTHVNQGASTGQLAARLTDFSSSVSALVTDLGDRMQDVVILSMSEFGRMVRQNGNGGTDHGHAGAMFVIGGGVKGGKVLGAWPGLAREQLYEGRDLALTTDFRAVFSEIWRRTGRHQRAERVSRLPATAPRDVLRRVSRSNRKSASPRGQDREVRHAR